MKTSPAVNTMIARMLQSHQDLMAFKNSECYALSKEVVTGMVYWGKNPEIVGQRFKKLVKANPVAVLEISASVLVVLAGLTKTGKTETKFDKEEFVSTNDSQEANLEMFVNLIADESKPFTVDLVREKLLEHALKTQLAIPDSAEHQQFRDDVHELVHHLQNDDMRGATFQLECMLGGTESKDLLSRDWALGALELIGKVVPTGK